MENTQPDRHVPWSALFTAANTWPLILVCLGVLLHAADGMLVATMLPVIVAEIGGVHLLSWVVMLYEVGSIVAGAACGLLISRNGLRTPMALAAILFASGCALSAMAPTMPVLLWGRLLQGLGGGGLMAMSFVAAGLLFAPHLQARVIGIVSTVWAASSFLGPLVGGLFVDLASWQAAFWSFAGVATALALLLIWINPQAGGDGDMAGAFPLRRLALLLMGVMAIAYAGEEISARATPLLIVLGLLLIAGFLRMDAQSTSNRLLPRIDLRLRDPVSAAFATIALFAAATIAIGIYAPYFLVTIHGLSPLAAGALIAVEALCWALAATSVSGRPESTDRRNVAAGLLLVSLGVTCLALSIAKGPILLILLGAMLQGLGFGIAWTFIMRLTISLAGPKNTALVSAAIPTVQRTGFAIGAASLGIVANLAGIESADPARAATAVFAASLLPLGLGLFALHRFLRPQ